ncbi:MAG: chromosomal replication initiator protein DnaA [Candidatus Marinimicrobia bacterium]|nr:chromosomal replication initiator protein DnaA [Candidatus Neomarinimicrobiota bacterium]MBT3997506.1 chromosomal replication initiator protein DnaA [Candidatus Neomarinimicrobiota bacterium]MBT4280013.1 chromosomal replication initiator protein DnaA [Candidatus Neomarinimicrobiota bacterium]MBT4570034.1 chromosomal replication initiator protein DnaA [Candidatus Neomarinimicrobiota bacterium]MBT4795786.1 chromosomal replication initiator protein DnaA [Candidatus Neomarinimicrobiota bacterium
MENLLNDPAEVWAGTKNDLRKDITNHAYNTWLDPISVIGINSNQLILEVPNQFFFEWIESHYGKRIENVLKKKTGGTLIPKYTVSTTSEQPAAHSPQEEFQHENKRQGRSSTKLNTRYTFNSYIEGPNNQFARAAAKSVSEEPGDQRFNPLVIYGGVGLGKTHLLHAIGNHILDERNDLKVVCASSEKFTLDFISSIQKNKTVEFSKSYRSADVLLIDDIQFFQGKEQTQEQFFHTFNELFQSGKQIVLTADRYPGDMKGLTDRLLSRFKSGLSVDVQQPNYETRVAILMDKAEQNGVEIPFDAIEFMARHLKNNIRELESTIIRLLAHASLTNQEIDFGLIKKVVKERLGNKPLNEITVEDITNRVADITKLSTSELVGPSRRKPIAEARQVAIYLCREILNTSLVSIGLHFGGRDHSTVIHACNKVEKMVSEEDRMRSLVGELKKEFSFGVN